MNNPVYLRMSILDVSKTLMYEFWYYCIEPKYKDKAELCYTDTDSFVIHIKTEDFYRDIANDVQKWFDTSNNEEVDKRPLPESKNEKIIGLFKDELAGKVIKEFVVHRARTYACLVDDDSENKKAKEKKKCVIKRRLLFKNYTDRLYNDKIILQSQHRFKSDCHNVYTEQINKIPLSSNDDKRLQTFDGITTYPYGTNAFKVCESELRRNNKI